MSVINDLTTDQRVHKHCTMLSELGYDVLLIGRTTRSSAPLHSRVYRTHRMKLPFEKGPLFYATFNLALFFQLLFRRADLLFSNDLDTLLPNFMVSRLRQRPLIYDSHEFFTEVPELTSRPRVQRVWKQLEEWILPKLTHAITVNRSIAELYKVRYGIEMEVVRNVPQLPKDIIERSRAELGLPEDKHIVILQGSGINIDRGAEEAVEAMRYVDEAILLIIGSGDVIPALKQHVAASAELKDRILFKDRMNYADMMAHTRVADLGLTLDKDTNINYRFSLPNKLFDYIHAGIPVLASSLKEVRAIVEDHAVGQTVESVEPVLLAQAMNSMLNSDRIEEWRENARKASAQLHWDRESLPLRNMITQLDG